MIASFCGGVFPQEVKKQSRLKLKKQPSQPLATAGAPSAAMNSVAGSAAMPPAAAAAQVPHGLAQVAAHAMPSAAAPSTAFPLQSSAVVPPAEVGTATEPASPHGAEEALYVEDID